ncbi:hypothetical protein BLA29_001561 [Euroglyphus maynei]|uniref:HEAT repeat-containing protein 5B n=1 Tax=Euroglyphus maynei TaxID=6958 RepID=A0A1Y3BIV7_EURMA|nr:hypothetical protein BLA29_001561 [Euroglyphus maynei]
MIACSTLQEHGDFLIKSETIACLQQLHMFDRNCYELNELISILCDGFISSRYLLRKASICCFQQIAQKDSKALIKYGSEWVARNKSLQTVGIISNFNLRANHRFPGILVALLDYETNSYNMNNIKKILNCLVHHVDEKNLNLWVTLCKEVLSASDAGATDSNENDHETEDGDFEESGFKANHNDSLNVKLTYRWQTRVFIMNILYKIINAACNQSLNDTAIHFDLNKAREKRFKETDHDFLVLHLPDLVRMSFIGATSDCDQLRMEGLKTLELVIDKFAHVPEPEFENHVILEQYQAQVGAALRPAFAVDTPSHVTAMACQVCSAWIGSGVARDLNDLRRVHQLLVSSLEKLHKHSNSKIYNESASTMEKLAILKAWAEVYVVAMLRNKAEEKKPVTNNSESLLDLVQPQLLTLSKYWIFALKDHALLTLPDEYYSQIPPDGRTFFNLETIDIVRPMYRASWPSILNAAALWLCSDKGFELLENDSSLNLTRFEQFYLLFGVCIESLSNPKSTEQAVHVATYLDSLKELIQHNEVTESILSNDTQLILELCQVLHRLLLTHEVSGSQVVITEIIKSLIDIQIRMKRADAESPVTGIEAHKSIVYSILEICLAILVRQLPQLCPQLAKTPEFSFVRSHKSANYLLFNSDNARIISNVLEILTDLCNVCRPADSVAILPTILYLFIGVFCELSVVCQTVYDEKLYEKQPILTFLKCIKNFCTSPMLNNDSDNHNGDEIRVKWIQLLQTAIARILDLSKTSGDEQKQDFISTLLAIGVFITHCSKQVLSHSQIQYPIINLMTRALKSENELVQLKCIETLKSVFTNEDQSNFYIHNLATELIDVYYSLVASFRMNQSLSTNRIASMINILSCLEILVGKANDEKRK